MSSWEKIAEITYENHPMQKKAVDAGRAMDNSLEVKNSGKSTMSKGGKFMNSNYLAYFDYELIVKRGLIQNHIEAIKKS